MIVRILTGDCRDVLKTLPDESVHCVVTSPPYFGLRDYGTASWEGGDPACEHIVVDATRTPWANEVPGPNGREKNPEAGHWRPKETGGHCGACGARRVDRQIGLELTPDAFVAEMVAVFREVRRVLRSDGTLWLNLGDSYAGSWAGNSMRTDGGFQREGGPGFQPLADGRYAARGGRTFGLKPKDLIGIPWRVAFALQADRWWLRQDIIWHKPNPMPESIEDRCTKAHEYLFLLAKSERYSYDVDAIAEGAVFGHGTGVGPDYAPPGGGAPHLGLKPRKRGVPPRHASYSSCDQSGLDGVARGRRNRRSVWTVATTPFPEAHFATFPPDLIVDCIKAGCPEGGTVLDPFGGAGTTGLVAQRLGRNAILIELNPDYVAMAERRIAAGRAGPVERGRILHGHKPADHGPLFTPATEAAE